MQIAVIAIFQTTSGKDNIMSDLRIPYHSLSIDAYRGLVAAGTALEQSPLGKTLIDFVFLRVSQINGCAFCIDKHARDLLRQGEDFQRINSLSTWRETGFYSERERAALAWAEAATRLANGEVPDRVFLTLKAHFSDQEIADLGFAVAVMNAFNRLAIGFKQPVKVVSLAVAG